METALHPGCFNPSRGATHEEEGAGMRLHWKNLERIG